MESFQSIILFKHKWHEVCKVIKMFDPKIEVQETQERMNLTVFFLRYN